MDDSIDGIYETLKQCALISKTAGGIGLAVHCIRASGSYIAGVLWYFGFKFTTCIIIDINSLAIVSIWCSSLSVCSGSTFTLNNFYAHFPLGLISGILLSLTSVSHVLQSSSFNVFETTFPSLL